MSTKIIRTTVYPQKLVNQKEFDELLFPLYTTSPVSLEDDGGHVVRFRITGLCINSDGKKMKLTFDLYYNHKEEVLLPSLADYEYLFSDKKLFFVDEIKRYCTPFEKFMMNNGCDLNNADAKKLVDMSDKYNQVFIKRKEKLNADEERRKIEEMKKQEQKLKNEAKEIKESIKVRRKKTFKVDVPEVKPEEVKPEEVNSPEKVEVVTMDKVEVDKKEKILNYKKVRGRPKKTI